MVMTKDPTLFTPLNSSNPIVQQANVDTQAVFGGGLEPGSPEFDQAVSKALESTRAVAADPQAALTARYNVARAIQQRGAGSTDEGIKRLVDLADHGIIFGGMGASSGMGGGLVSVETGKGLSPAEVAAHMNGPTRKY
jgi:hypothetical protein